MIKALSEDLRNKISAGEVVENPASVVKELIENSLDANSTELIIIVEKGGHQTIQVRDNGIGISSLDLPSAIMRFHTSKIESLNDLFEIGTLGFRGEALASIASVSEMKITSNVDEKEGASIEISGGSHNGVEPAPKINGTEITVRDLFYNTPVRKKFLKTPRTELRKIVDIVRRYGLAFPERSFKLVADGREIFNLGKENLEQRIDKLLDPTYSKNLLPINITKGDYSFSGFIGNLNLIRSRPGEQYLFLNRRFIKDRLMNRAIYNAYESLIKRGEYPFFVVNLVLPKDQADVNVHPMKLEVRFKDEWRLFNILKHVVQDSLQSIMQTVPAFDTQFEFPTDDNNKIFTIPDVITEKNVSFQGQQQELKPAPSKPYFEPNHNLKRAKEYVSQLAEASKENTTDLSIENIWQIHKKYILSEINSGLVIIDQHVAHERILYEEALEAFESTSMASQTLLFPETLDFSHDDFDVLLDVLPYLEKIGFKIKKQNQTSILIEAIPSELSIGNEKNIIREILDSFLRDQKKYSSFQEGLAAMFACKAAIKAGDVLVKEEMQELVNRLFSTKHPYYCPHGRPIIIKMSLEELDGRFERH